MTPKQKTHLRLRIMGDVLRNPATRQRDIRERLGIEEEAVVRITLGRLVDAGLVRRLDEAKVMLTRAGIEELATIRQWVSP